MYRHLSLEVHLINHLVFSQNVSTGEVKSQK